MVTFILQSSFQSFDPEPVQSGGRPGRLGEPPRGGTAMQPAGQPGSAGWDPAPHRGEPGTVLGRAPPKAPEHLELVLEAPGSTGRSPRQRDPEPGAEPGGARSYTWASSRLRSLLRGAWPKKPGTDCCGRSQRQVLPEPNTSRAKQTPLPRLSRVNGWSKPLSKYQVLSWAMFLALTLALYCVFIPMLPREWNFISFRVSSGLLLLLIVSYIACVSIDPAEEAVRKKQIYNEPLPMFDKSKHRHVIEDLYCSLCGVAVGPKAKHCGACNKCVAGFDHHCQWLNNCVGSRNYWWFFCCMASILAWLLCVLSILLYIFIQHLVDPCVLPTDPYCAIIGSQNGWPLFMPYFHVNITTSVVVIIGVFVLVLDLVCLLLIGQLFFFHLNILAQRITTYDYVNRKRQKADTSLRITVKSFQTEVFPQEPRTTQGAP